MIKLKIHLSQAFSTLVLFFEDDKFKMNSILLFGLYGIYIHKQYDKISDHNELDTFVVITYFQMFLD